MSPGFIGGIPGREMGLATTGVGGGGGEKGGNHTLPARGASLGPLGEEDSMLLLCDAQREDLRSLDLHTAWGTYGLRKSSRA